MRCCVSIGYVSVPIGVNLQHPVLASEIDTALSTIP